MALGVSGACQATRQGRTTQHVPESAGAGGRREMVKAWGKPDMSVANVHVGAHRSPGSSMEERCWPERYRARITAESPRVCVRVAPRHEQFHDFGQQSETRGRGGGLLKPPNYGEPEGNPVGRLKTVEADHRAGSNPASPTVSVAQLVERPNVTREVWRFEPARTPLRGRHAARSNGTDTAHGDLWTVPGCRRHCSGCVHRDPEEVRRRSS